MKNYEVLLIEVRQLIFKLEYFLANFTWTTFCMVVFVLVRLRTSIILRELSSIWVPEWVQPRKCATKPIFFYESLSILYYVPSGTFLLCRRMGPLNTISS